MISCPSCNQPVDPNDRSCPHCGVDIGIAAILAEQILRRDTGELRMPIAPEVLIPRIGDYLIEKNLVTQTQINMAVRYQTQRDKEGKPILIGQALVELGYLDQRKLDMVITDQIFQLQSALRRANQDLEDRVNQRTTELHQAMVRLTELNQLKSNFVANISHELRTPLTHLKGYLELLLDENLGVLTPQQKDALKVMTSSEIRLERLIEDLIQFSIAARGDFELRLAELDIVFLLRNVIQRNTALSNDKKVSLVSEIPDDLPNVIADAEKIEWVVSELANNALKFTKAGGTIEIGACVEDPNVLIYVKDNGIGIPSNQVEKIFEPFHQIDSSATRKYGGTGLGLSLVQRIIDAHNSKIVVKSEEARGTKFSFGLLMAGSSQEGR